MAASGIILRPTYAWKEKYFINVETQLSQALGPLLGALFNPDLI
jgi:hypothetical protein